MLPYCLSRQSLLNDSVLHSLVFRKLKMQTHILGNINFTKINTKLLRDKTGLDFALQNNSCVCLFRSKHHLNSMGLASKKLCAGLLPYFCYMFLHAHIELISAFYLLSQHCKIAKVGDTNQSQGIHWQNHYIMLKERILMFSTRALLSLLGQYLKLAT